MRTATSAYMWTLILIYIFLQNQTTDLICLTKTASEATVTSEQNLKTNPTMLDRPRPQETAVARDMIQH